MRNEHSCKLINRTAAAEKNAAAVLFFPAFAIFSGLYIDDKKQWRSTSWVFGTFTVFVDFSRDLTFDFM